MKHWRIAPVLSLLALGASVPPETALAQGFYVSVRAGTALGADTEALLESFNSPTRCDVLLYADPADAPSDADCNRRDPFAGIYAFDPGTGTAGSVAVGYSFGGVSMEVEAVQRTQVVPAARFSLLHTANRGAVQAAKLSEWSPTRPPSGDISEFRTRQFFANAYYSLPRIGRFTPYVGIGGGLATIDLAYEVQFTRKSVSEGYLEVFGGSASDPGASPDWQRAAAGTVSALWDDAADAGFGYQVLGGVDYEVGRGVALGIGVRWTSLPAAEDATLLDMMRSHSGVHADGVTPVTTDFTFSKLGYVGISTALKVGLGP